MYFLSKLLIYYSKVLEIVESVVTQFWFYWPLHRLVPKYILRAMNDSCFDSLRSWRFALICQVSCTQNDFILWNILYNMISCEFIFSFRISKFMVWRLLMAGSRWVWQVSTYRPKLLSNPLFLETCFRLFSRWTQNQTPALCSVSFQIIFSGVW